MMRLLIRADASTSIGSGHFMRCLALAQGWQAHGGSVTFLARCESESLRRTVQSLGMRFIPLEKVHPEPLDLETTLSTLEQVDPTCVVLDGYHFNPDYQQEICAAGPRLLVIDDTAHLPYYSADLVLNQNINAEGLTYHCHPDTRLLLGTRYALLRPEFLAWRNWRREVNDNASKLLVTMGGSDPDNVTLKVIRALQYLELPNLEAKIIVGPINPHLETLRDAVQGSKLQLLTNVTDVPELMAWADLAITAGGTTSWELAFMGLPGMVLVLAKNQRGIAEGLDAAGIAVNLAAAIPLSTAQIGQAITKFLDSPAKRKEMGHLGTRLIDGMGAERVVEAINLLHGSPKTREATISSPNG